MNYWLFAVAAVSGYVVFFVADILLCGCVCMQGCACVCVLLSPTCVKQCPETIGISPVDQTDVICY